jgi:hypothetical protein
MTLAVYRNASGLYFIAPAGRASDIAEAWRVSPYYVDQARAVGALIDKQHDYNASRA